MKKTYEQPIINVISLDEKDIIVTSENLSYGKDDIFDVEVEWDF